MASRLLPLFIIGFCLIFTDARILEKNGIAEGIFSEHASDEKICTLCEQFTAQAIEYIGQNKTQEEIVDNLHVACSRLHSLEKQCILLVDYYAPLFFMEVSIIDPQDFCKKVNLCEKMTLSSLLGQDQACAICQNTVTQILDKLDDPETQLDIIQALLKACGRLENYMQQCKKLVFEYGPVILTNMEKILKTSDICTAIHVCKADDSVLYS